MHCCHAAHCVHRRQRDRQERREKDDEHGRDVSDAEPENRDRNPGEGRDGAQEFDQRRDRHLGTAQAAQEHPEGDANHDRQQISPRDAEEGGHDVLDEEPLLRDLHDRVEDREWSGQQGARREADGEAPENEEQDEPGE